MRNGQSRRVGRERESDPSCVTWLYSQWPVHVHAIIYVNSLVHAKMETNVN